jgi:hypothetical protein
MEAICSETLVDTQRTTRRYIPKGDTFHNYRCENLKSYKVLVNKQTKTKNDKQNIIISNATVFEE